MGSSAGPGVRKGKVSHTLTKEGRRCQSSEESASESIEAFGEVVEGNLAKDTNKQIRQTHLLDFQLVSMHKFIN